MGGSGCVGGRPAVAVAAEGDDVGPEPRVGRQDSVVAVAVDAGWGDQTGEGVQKLEGREGEEGAAVGGGTGRSVEDPTDAGVIGPPCRLRLDAQAFEGKRGSGAVAEEALAAGALGRRARSRGCGRRHPG